MNTVVWLRLRYKIMTRGKFENEFVNVVFCGVKREFDWCFNMIIHSIVSFLLIPLPFRWFIWLFAIMLWFIVKRVFFADIKAEMHRVDLLNCEYSIEINTEQYSTLVLKISVQLSFHYILIAEKRHLFQFKLHIYKYNLHDGEYSARIQGYLCWNPKKSKFLYYENSSSHTVYKQFLRVKTIIDCYLYSSLLLEPSWSRSIWCLWSIIQLPRAVFWCWKWDWKHSSNSIRIIQYSSLQPLYNYSVRFFDWLMIYAML